VGGLSVLRQLVATMPATDFVYLGDTARLPYGNRSRTEVATFVEEIIGFLADFKLDAVIMACNTSAALAHDVAVRRSAGAGFDLFNLIEPMAQYIAESNIGSVGVMATLATAKSHAFARALTALNFGGAILEIGCPKLVPLIESGSLGQAAVEAELDQALHKYLLELAGVDAIILGCTHFPFLQKRIEVLLAGPLKPYFPGTVAILDPAVVLSKKMKASVLFKAIPDAVATAEANEASLNAENIEIFTTGAAQSFIHTASYCLGHELLKVRHIRVKHLIAAEKIWQGDHALPLSPAFVPSISFA